MDEVCKMILERFSERSQEIFGQQLTGVYLHGSSVMNCFNFQKSDIDLIFIVDGDITEQQKLEFLETVLELNAVAPPKGLELSIVKKEFCKPFVYPTPYEFHFSNGYKEEAENTPVEFINRIHGTDRDLAAHFTVLYHRGMTVFGEAIRDIFECPGREAYTDSIMYDVENAVIDIHTSPVYMILNLCRVLAFLEEGAVLSKKEGGEWGIAFLPERHKSTVQRAICEYTDNIDAVFTENELTEYASYMLSDIYKRINDKENEI